MFPKKILVVDDEPNFTKLIVEYFKSMGYEVLSAPDPQEALTLFKKNKPRVVLLDFNMPLVTGDQFLPVLQAIDPTAKVIVLTGCIEEEVEEKFRGMGYFAFFEKGSLSLDKLRQKVDEALRY